MLTLLLVLPAFVQDDERFRCMVEPFIVFRCALRRERRRWAVVLAVLLGDGAARAQAAPSIAPAGELIRSTEALASLVSPAVVQIVTTS